MQDIFSVHPFGDLRATPENWLDSSIDSTVLEEISSGLSVLREEEEDVLEFEIGYSTSREETSRSTPGLTITPPNSPVHLNNKSRSSPHERLHSPLRSLSLNTSFHSPNDDERGSKFDPVVGSPSKRFHPASTANSFSPFSNEHTFTSTYTTPDPLQKNASDPHLRSTNSISNQLSASRSRADYARRVDQREVVEDEGEEEGSRYVLVQNLPADATRNDLEILVTLFSNTIKGIYDGRLRSHGLVVLVFYDVRDAVNAVTCLEWDRRFRVRLDVRCILREGVDTINNHRRPNPLLSTSEGLLVLSARAAQNSSINSWSPSTSPPQFPLSSTALQAHLSKFGPLRSFRIVPTPTDFATGGQGEEIFVVEFFDERDCERALRAWNGLRIGGVEVCASFGVANDSYQFRTDSASPPFMNRESNLSAMSTPFSTAQRLSPSPMRIAEPFASVANTIGSRESGFARFSSLVGRREEAKYVVPPRFDNSINKPIENHPPSFQLPSVPSHLPLPTPSISREQRNYSPPRFSAPTILPRDTSSPIASTGGRGGVESPAYGIYRDDKIPVGNVLHLDRIEQGLERRTTLMLKNIPNRLDADSLISLINEVVPNSFDFLYLRIDFANKCNVGYGFINFIDTASMYKWAKTKLGQRWNICSSEKVYVASFAAIQGKEALIAKFRNSSVMDEERAFRPRIFCSDGPKKGFPEPFPESNDAKRKARSVANLQNIGLFPTQKPIFKLTRVDQ